jgi:hypothetical protein
MLPISPMRSVDRIDDGSAFGCSLLFARISAGINAKRAPRGALFFAS